MKTVNGTRVMVALCMLFLVVSSFSGFSRADTRAAGDPLNEVEMFFDVLGTDQAQRQNHTITNAEGYYEIMLPPGQLQQQYVDFPPEGYFPLWDQDLVSNNLPLSSGTVLERNMTLVPIPAGRIAVQGYLHVKGQEPGADGSGIRVYGESGYFSYTWRDNQNNEYKDLHHISDGGWTTVVNAEETGKFSFEAPPGDFHMNIRVPGYLPLTSASFSAITSRWANISLEPEPTKTCYINGTVLGDSSPFGGVSVSVKGNTTGGKQWLGEGMTDTSGIYSISAPPGSYDVSFYSYGWVEKTLSTGVLSDNGTVTLNTTLSLVPEPTQVTEDVKIHGYVKAGTYTGGPTPLSDDLDGDGFPDIPGDPDDTTPPAKITDLSVKEVGASYAVLTWTAVGDDGNVGTAFAYFVVYSKLGAIVPSSNISGRIDSIARDNDNLTVYHQIISPKPAGQTETLKVTGLEENTRYWFFVAVIDDAGLWNRSNSPSGKTAKLLGFEQVHINAAAGGTVALQGASIVIPAGALSFDTFISMEILEFGQGELGLAQGFSLAGNVFQFGPSGTVFSEPVTITLPFDSSMIDENGEVAIYLWNSSTGEWERIENPWVDEAAGTVSVNITHFSRYAVLATAEDISPPTDDPVGNILGMLGYLGPIPIMLVVILLAIVLVGVGLKGGRKENRTPPAQPRPPQMQQRAPPHAPAPPPAQPQPYYPGEPAPYPAPQPAPLPMNTTMAAAATAAAPVAGGKKKPSGGKCSQCGAKTLVFNDNGSGVCSDCGRTFWWDKSKEPAVVEKPQKPAEPQKQEGKKKPSGGKCSQCGAKTLSFYDDGSGVCSDCGRTFWWDKSKEPKAKPKQEEPKPKGNNCPQCGGSDLVSYPDGSRMCHDCENVW